MESAEITSHTYKCAGCGAVFTTEDFAVKCPYCRCKILIHREGEMRRGKGCSCGGGNCASCGGSCSCH